MAAKHPDGSVTWDWPFAGPRRWGTLGVSLVTLLLACPACRQSPSEELQVTRGALTVPTFVQADWSVPPMPQILVPVTYGKAQIAGDLNVAIVGWNDTTSSVASLSDTTGNNYQLAVGPTRSASSISQSIYYAKNIAAASAGSNVVSVQFNAPAAFPDIRILEYSGIDHVNPLDAVIGSSGDSTISSSGLLTTSHATDLLVAGNIVATGTGDPVTGFIRRVFTDPDGDIADDSVVTSTGAYSESIGLSSEGEWVMQMAAFRAADDSPCPATACRGPGLRDPQTGSCSAGSPVADGISCNDNNACTTGDHCQAGACVSQTQVSCPGDACRPPGTCDLSTGLCSVAPAYQDDTACDDGNRCTPREFCHAGSCVPESSVNACTDPYGPYYAPLVNLGSTQGVSAAWAINDSGEVIGIEGRGAYLGLNDVGGPAVPAVAFRWTPSGGKFQLPASVGRSIFPRGVNNSGVIVGTAVDYSLSSIGRVFRFDPAVDTDLQFIQIPTGTGTGINSAGQITGHGYFPSGHWMFRATGSSAQSIPGPALNYQVATAIDESGGLVGYTVRPNGQGNAAAIRYTDALGFEYLNQRSLPPSSDWNLDPLESGRLSRCHIWYQRYAGGWIRPRWQRTSTWIRPDARHDRRARKRHDHTDPHDPEISRERRHPCHRRPRY